MRVVEPPLSALKSLRQPMTDGEQKVFNLFNEHLSDNWEIYVQPHLNGLRPDFVLLNPEIGIAVFEVKDWNLNAMRYFTRESPSGHRELWAEKDGKEFRRKGRNPVTQISLYQDEIYGLYCPRMQKKAGHAAITAGIIFPFAPKIDVVKLLSPFLTDTMIRYMPVSGFEAIRDGDISEIFPEARPPSSRLMSEDLAKDLRGWLVEPDFASTQRVPLEMDRNQRQLAETRTETGYRRIKGPAGSGKSLVLAARAAWLANNGKSVLVMTFNVTLMHYLRDLIVRALDAPERIRNIQFASFHMWCKRVCYEVGWNERYHELWPSGGSDENSSVLDTEMALLADDAVKHPNASRYDAILVDEGQDFRPLWWNVLRKACKPGGEMILVADATQDIYGTASAWTDREMTGAGFPGGRWTQLSTSYRLPPDTLTLARSFAEQFLPKGSRDLPEPEQRSLDLYPSHNRWVQCLRTDVAEACSEEILSLMLQAGKDGLANADITFLTDTKQTGAAVVAILDEHGIRAVHTFGSDHRRQKMGFYMGDAKVKATTLHSFKGWESRMLVVCLSDAAHSTKLALAYAGITRLKRSRQGSWLSVVCSAPELCEYGKTWPDSVVR
jgi:hypothetical protein